MNVYYDVGSDIHESGLVRVGELDEPDLSYEYNTLVVVKHSHSGRVFYASDTGCSCPTPFEDYYFNSPDDTNMDEIKKGDSFTSFEREATGFPVPQGERDELISVTKKLLEVGGESSAQAD